MDWYDPAWTKVKGCDIDGSKVGTGTYARVLISIVDAELAAGAQADGDDILFTDTDGLTKLKHDLVSYESGTGTLIAYVLVPSLTAGVDKQLWMYFGNAGCAAQEDKAGTWKDAPAKKATAVYHYEGGVVDSSGNGFDGTDNGTGADTGWVGDCRSFDGGSAFVTMPAADFYAVQTLSYVSVGALIKASSAGPAGRQTIIVKGNAGSEVLSLYLDETGALVFSDYYATDWLYYAMGDEDLRDDTWHRVWGVRSGSTFKVYVDGVDATVVSSGGLETIARTEDVYVGARLNADYFFDGLIDELMIVEEALSAGDILTDYNSTVDPATFVTVGGESTMVEASALVPAVKVKEIEAGLDLPMMLLESTAMRMLPYTGLASISRLQALQMAQGPNAEIDADAGLPMAVLKGVASARLLPFMILQPVEGDRQLPVQAFERISGESGLPVWPRQERDDRFDLPVTVSDRAMAGRELPETSLAGITEGTEVPATWMGTINGEAYIPAMTLKELRVGAVVPVTVVGTAIAGRAIPFAGLQGVAAGAALPASLAAWIEAANQLAVSVVAEAARDIGVPVEVMGALEQSAGVPFMGLAGAGRAVALSAMVLEGVEAGAAVPTIYGAIIAQEGHIPVAVWEGVVQGMNIPVAPGAVIAVVTSVPAYVLEQVVHGLNTQVSVGQGVLPTPVSASRALPVIVLRGIESGADLNATIEAVAKAVQGMPVEWWDEVKETLVAGEYVIISMTPRVRMEKASEADTLRRTAARLESET